MQEFLDVTALAVLQGVAEFLPISSSGHLVIGQHLLGMNEPGMRLEIFLHVGTLASIFAFYRRPIAEIIAGLLSHESERRLAAWGYAAKIIVSALPAVAVYFTFKKTVDDMFENVRMVGALMGCGQAIAILPGVSRSGMTLAAARAGRVSPEAAAEFSFLMSAPLIAGDALLHIKEAFASTSAEIASGPSWGAIAWGAAVSAVVGYFSLAILLRALRGKWFWLFGPYCFTVGLLVVCLCK